ncbi:hypothetical protein BSL78_22903 [Apostichopus japonicus]|uniref:Uncharacterized protein n=1 Tax=Stichopus japonicus TaxID=307972 RepID=A0A2G8JX01_STIJA|nr:hypothetical protein BSL78_22903 [Apostichopus japonicus]
MMKLIAEQENTPSMYSSAPVVRSHSKSGDGASPASGFKNNGTSPSPRPKSGGGSPSLNNSASEVMKLLASKNQERNNLILDSLPTVPLKPVSPPPPPPSSRLSDMSPPAPASQHPPQRPPPTSDEFGKSMIGAADIMKQLASSYSQNSPHRLQILSVSLLSILPQQIVRPHFPHERTDHQRFLVNEILSPLMNIVRAIETWQNSGDCPNARHLSLPMMALQHSKVFML